MKLTKKVLDNNRNIMSRRLAFQAIYAWDINNSEIETITSFFDKEEEFKKCDNKYFNEIVTGVISHINEIDETINNCSKLNIDKIGRIELSIVRCAVYELSIRKILDKKIIISESLKLTKKFSTLEGVKFVNAIIDDI
tara:strand:- start:118 stop:531 length:414 start_codon:yes stop_codon:yes gene_type:complete